MHGLNLAIIVGLCGRSVIITQIQNVLTGTRLEIPQRGELQVVIVSEGPLHLIAHGEAQGFSGSVVTEAAQGSGPAAEDGGCAPNIVIILRYNATRGIGDGGKLAQKIVGILGKICYLVDDLAYRS